MGPRVGAAVFRAGTGLGLLEPGQRLCHPLAPQTCGTPVDCSVCGLTPSFLPAGEIVSPGPRGRIWPEGPKDEAVRTAPRSSGTPWGEGT